MVYWMVEWWAVEKDETMVATTAVMKAGSTAEKLVVSWAVTKVAVKGTSMAVH